MLFEELIAFLLEKCPEVRLLDRMVALFLTFRGTSKLLAIVAAPVYNPIHSDLRCFHMRDKR